MQLNEIKQYNSQSQVEKIELISDDILMYIRLVYNDQSSSQSSITQQPNQIQIKIYQLDATRHIKIYSGRSSIVGQAKIFKNIYQLSVFLGAKENYTWKADRKILQLYFEVRAVQFSIKRKQIIRFQQVFLTGKEYMEICNQVLRKQLGYYREKVKNNPNPQIKIKETKLKSTSRSNQQMILKQKIQIRGSNSDSPSKQIPDNSLKQRKTKSENDQQNKVNINNWKGMKNIPVVHLKKTIEAQKSQSRSKYMQKNKKIRHYAAKKTPGQYNRIQKYNKNLESKNKETQIIQMDEQQVQQNKFTKKSTITLNLDKQQQIIVQQISRQHIVDNKYEIQFSNGDKYVGQMNNDKIEGKGVFTSRNFTFQGVWQNGEVSGFGTIQYKTGAIQKGIYIKSFKRNGLGFDKYQNGQQYEGNFIKDEKNGFGKYKYLNGQYYQGYWKNNKKNGKGTWYYSDKSKYEGYWLNDRKNGEGIYYGKFGKIKQMFIDDSLQSQDVLPNDKP